MDKKKYTSIGKVKCCGIIMVTVIIEAEQLVLYLSCKGNRIKYCIRRVQR